MSFVERLDASGVTTLTLNRPEKMNAITPEMVSELAGHFRAIASADDVGCVVLRGAGRCFSAGLDVSGVGTASSEQRRLEGAEMVDLLESIPQPTIAALHGFCFTGALELALGCDLLVAAESTVLGDTHSKLGLVPVWGASVRLPERVGLASAKQILLTGRRIDATAAHQIGLLNYVWPDLDFAAEVDQLAADISANSWGSNARIKKLLNSDSSNRTLRLAFERTRPWGLPADSEARRTASVRKPAP
jgi:enoyl-CoA hydratase